MDLHFEDIRAKLSPGVQRRMGVIVAQDPHTLEAVAHAVGLCGIVPILYGQKELIAPIWEAVGNDAALPEIVECGSEQECVSSAISDVKSGSLDCIMKGHLETASLLKAVVKRDTGIRRGEVLSTVAMMESPYYHKMFAVTDVGVITYPTLRQKKGIIENAVRVFQCLGVERPKVAVLTAVEKPNEKMPETLDAAALKEMNRSGELRDCIVEGPISYDLCMDPEAAALKEYHSPVAGDPDILLVSDIAAGNILAKCLTCTGGAKTCGIVCGALVPIVLTSRAATAEDKFRSIVLSAVVGRQ